MAWRTNLDGQESNGSGAGPEAGLPLHATTVPGVSGGQSQQQQQHQQQQRQDKMGKKAASWVSSILTQALTPKVRLARS